MSEAASPLPGITTSVSPLINALDAASLYYATGHLDPDVLKAKYAKVDNASWGGFYAPCYAPL